MTRNLKIGHKFSLPLDVATLLHVSRWTVYRWIKH